MHVLHHREYMEAGAAVATNCSHQRNVQLMGNAHFAAVRSGRRHRYQGGFYRRLLARIAVPRHRLVERRALPGRGAAMTRPSIRVLSPG